MMLKRLAVAALCWLAFASIAFAATLLPNGEQTFLDQNGAPLAGGQVYFYIPNTLTPKATYQNSSGTVSNPNPVVLDGSGRAIIYGSGQYRQQVYDVNGNLIWDQPTSDTSAAGAYSWAGTSAGTANAQTLSAPNFTLGDGQQIGFIAGFTNTAAFTVIPNGGSPIGVVKASATGPTNLSSGDVIAGNQYFLSYSATNGDFQIDTLPAAAILPSAPIASSATTDIGTLPGHNASVTGSTTITSFGTSASVTSQFYYVTFAGSPLIIASSSILTPQGGNIQASAGASAFLAYLGGGVWQVLNYTASASPAFGQVQFSLGSSTTVELSAKGGSYLTIDGVNYQVPAAGVTASITSAYVNGVAGQTLSAGTLYYVYAFANAGVVTLDFSTTGHSADSTAGNVGVEIKTGDSTRSLVGMVYPAPGPVFARSGANIFLASWFNKSGVVAFSSFTTGRATTSGTFVELNSEIRCQFLIWGGESAQFNINGNTEVSAGSYVSTALGIDSAAPQDAYTVIFLNGTTWEGPATISQTIGGLSEGFHYATVLGATSAGTATWAGSAAAATRTTLTVGLRE